MNIKTFYAYYDLKKLDIYKIIIKDCLLTILINFDVEENYIGNGLRSNFSYNNLVSYSFHINNSLELTLENNILIQNYLYDDTSNKLFLKINDNELIIDDQIIKIKSYL